MVVFGLLAHPDLADMTYRGIATHAGVAVGRVGVVLKGLRAAGYKGPGSKLKTLVRPGGAEFELIGGLRIQVHLANVAFAIGEPGGGLQGEPQV